MRKSAVVLILILFLGIVPGWTVKPVQAATYVPLVELNQNFDSYAYGGDVLTKGIVTYVDSNGFTIQNGTGAYTGIYVYTGYKSYPSVQPGDVVEVYGYPKYYKGLRELSVNPSYGEYYSVVGTAEVPQPAVIPTADYDRPEYQSVLVKFVDAKITGRYDSWYTKLWIDDGSGEAYIFSSKNLPQELEPGAKFKYFIGVVSVYNYDYEVLPVEYALYNPSVKVVDVDYSSFMKGIQTKVTATVLNNGTTASNVTFVALFDDVVVYSGTFELLPGEKRGVEFYITPNTTGKHTLTVRAEDSEKILEVNVAANIYEISTGLAPYYEKKYLENMNSLAPLYDNLTSLIKELEGCGVGLGDVEDYVKDIEAKMALIQSEYEMYKNMKALVGTDRGVVSRGHYYYKVLLLMYSRHMLSLTQKVTREVQFVLPILREAQKAYCTPGNETQAPENATVRLIKVLIDASHGQYYNPTKTDQNGMSSLIENIKNELGWVVDINTEPVTYEKLKEYDVFIITNPSRDITDDEAQAIQQFVESGGGLLILGESYYGHVYYRSLNRVVGKYGIQFNNDELMDDDINTGRKWFPLVGIYNLDHPAMQFLTEDHQMYYNGDTLTITGNVVWLITGYETSYSEDIDGNIIYEKGSKPIVAAAVEVGSGRIVAYGSSRALSNTYYGNYIKTNWPFIKGVLLWLAHQS
ncbi:DUF4350 domain-containing protein [Thermococcus sp. M36]|uniref:DUF4350 domain-containing protein n=1 Tax=Thermococcus sp. M36 TaxID=1638261 RepID=UPI0014393679|nr:DUF4350 domain-containing protein [Thermococcus sp. M36]